MKVDGNRLVRVVNIPKGPLAALEKPACRDQARDIRTAHSQTVPQPVGFGGVRIDARDVLQRYFELRLGSEELICARDVDDQRRVRDLELRVQAFPASAALSTARMIPA